MQMYFDKNNTQTIFFLFYVSGFLLAVRWALFSILQIIKIITLQIPFDMLTALSQYKNLTQ